MEYFNYLLFIIYFLSSIGTCLAGSKAAGEACKELTFSSECASNACYTTHCCISKAVKDSCPWGSSCNSNGNCAECVKGQYVSSSDGTCKSCPSGKTTKEQGNNFWADCKILASAFFSF